MGDPAATPLVVPEASALFEQLPDAVYLIDPASSAIVWCNRAGWESLGLSPEQVLHHSVLSLQIDVTGAPAWSEIAEVIRRSRGYTFVGRHRHAQGHEIAVEVNTGAFVDRGREYFLSVARDVTRRFALEAELRTREKQLWFALNEASDGLWDWNVGSGEVFFSPQLKRMLGYGPDEMAPTLATWVDNVHPDDHPQVMAVLSEHLEDRRVRYDAEYRLRDRNGDWRWVHDRGRVCERDAQGRASRVVGMVHDITARRQAADELERHRHHLQDLVDERTAALSIAKDAAEEASRAKSRFLANMSHELRTPLAAIMGMTTLALQATRDARLRDQLGKVDQAAHHLLNVINDILDLSKIEADRMTLEAADFAVGALVDEVAQLAGPQAHRSGLAFTVQVDDALRPMVLRGDPLRLKQVLLNLVGNALKFTPQGQVDLRVHDGGRRDGAQLLCIEVEDTGIGIAPDALERLFNPFEQADNSMSRRYGGTGLGLAICRRLVRMMGGDIQVRSTPGQGSCFRMTLPLAPGHAPTTVQPRSLPAAPLARHAGRRVLVVEDEPVNREVLTALLTQAGLAVDAVEDGEMALDLLQRQRYALVLLDMHMPRLNGIQVATAMRADTRWAGVPVIALTANVFAEDRQACLDAGMDAHLGKPVDAADLFASVAHMLDHGRAASPGGRSQVPDRA